MKRNLSSQAIRAMAIGMAVTMGATTALSDVAGNVAVVKAEEVTRDYAADAAKNGATKPDTTNKYIEVQVGNAFLMFEVTANDSTANGNETSDGTVKLLEIKSASQITQSDNLAGTAKEQAYIGTIGGTSTDLVKVTYNSSGSHVAFKMTEVEANAAAEAVTVDGVEFAKLAKNVTTVGAKAFNNVTFSNGLDLTDASSLTDITTAFAGATIEGNLTLASTVSTQIPADAFKGTTINGNLDLSAVSANADAFKGTDGTDNKGITVTGELKLKSDHTGAANDFDYVTVGILDLSAVTDALTSSTFSGANIGELKLNAAFTGGAGTFKKCTIGTADMSGVTNVSVEAFKGTDDDANKGITITSSLKLKDDFAGAEDIFAHTDIATLDLSNNTTALGSLKFANATIGEFKAPTDSSYTSVADAFKDATIGTLDLSEATGTVAADALNGVTVTDTLKLPTDSSKLATITTGNATSIKNIVHNGATIIGENTTISGTVDFGANNITAAVLQGATLSQGSKIVVADATKLTNGTSANAFDFADGSKTNIEFTAYETGKEADIKAACGDGVTGEGKVNIILPAGKETEVGLLNTALEGATNVKAYLNNVVAGIDNPSSVTLAKDSYILTSDGKLFKVVRPKNSGDLPVAEAAFVGTVAEAGTGGEANGTTIPYVATLAEDTLSVSQSSGEAVACKVNQIGDGTNTLSKYTLGNTPTKGDTLKTITLDIPEGNEIKIAANAFKVDSVDVRETGVTVTITDTTGVTAIGNEAFKGATITAGTLNTANVTSFGASAFEGATLTPAQEIVINETATIDNKAFAFKTATADTKIKLQAYTADNQTAVVGAFTGASELNVTVELPYSIDATTLKESLTSALTEAGVTGVTVKVAANGNAGTEAPKANDIITTTSGDVFEVLEGNDAVKLVSLGNQQVAQSRAVTTFDGTFENGVVKVTYNGSTEVSLNVTEIGNGSTPITTQELTVETLAPYMTNATTIAANALKDVQLTGTLEISDKVTSIGENALNLAQGIGTVVKLGEYGETITKDMLVTAIGTTTAMFTIELPENADSTSLKNVLTSAPNVIVRTTLPADAVGTIVKSSNSKGDYTFKIIEQAEDSIESEKLNKVALIGFEAKQTHSTRSVDTMISGNRVIINGEVYNLTQLGDGEKAISGITSDALEGMTGSVTTIAPKAFEGNTNITAVSSGATENAIYLPALAEVGESAFAGATNLATVKLENVTEVKDSAFSKTGVTTVELPKATTVGANAFANNEKLTVVNVGTEVDSQIKMDSTALSGSSNITVVNTNTASKDQVTEAIKQSGTKNNVTVSAGGTTETVKPEETKKPSNSISGGGANIGTSNNTSNTTTQTTTSTETTTETTTESTTQIEDKTLSLDVISLPSVEGTAVSFSDVSESSWAKPYIDKLSTAGIINGSNGKFNPNGQTKRADVTVMLVKLLGLTPETNNKFADVDASAYYAPYVGTASSYGIVNGSNGMFKPESVISRQDTMVMISQILKGLNLNVNTDTSVLDQFSDVNNISGYAQESVAILVNSGIVSGSNGKLNPTNPVTRAEMATIMSKLYDVISSASN